jgi:putative transposase
MPNPAHRICVPRTEDSVRLAIGKAHLRCTRRVNFREGWEDFLSVPTRAEEARILSRHG